MTKPDIDRTKGDKPPRPSTLKCPEMSGFVRFAANFPAPSSRHPARLNRAVEFRRAAGGGCPQCNRPATIANRRHYCETTGTSTDAAGGCSVNPSRRPNTLPRR